MKIFSYKSCRGFHIREQVMLAETMNFIAVLEKDSVIVNTTLLLYMLRSFITCSGFSYWPSSSHVEVYSLEVTDLKIGCVVTQNIAHLKVFNSKFSSPEEFTSIIEKVTLWIKVQHIPFVRCKSFKHPIWEEFFTTYAVMYLVWMKASQDLQQILFRHHVIHRTKHCYATREYVIIVYDQVVSSERTVFTMCVM